MGARRNGCDSASPKKTQKTSLKLFLGDDLRRSLGDPKTKFRQQIDLTRTLFVTTNNRLGICTPKTRVGNERCVLFGGDHVLHVIRPKSGDDYYQLVGECYVHGYMRGNVVRELDSRKSEFKEEWITVV